MVSTKNVERRPLRFSRMSDIEREVDQLDHAPSLRNSGNWTPGQVLLHVTKFIEWSMDGVPFKGPFIMRYLGPMMRDRVLIRPMKPGFKLPRIMRAAEPEPEISWEDAVARFRKAIERLESGDRMIHPSPVFGELNHEQWSQLHCRHAELHLSFLHPETGSSAE